jgi:hypothetical protein
MTRLGLCLALLLLPACAAGPPRPEWRRPDATVMDFNRDRYDCEQRHTEAPRIILGGGGLFRQRLDERLFRSCMRALGWVHRDD